MSMNGWATLIVFLPPALLLFTLFVALPMVEAGRYSFFNWDGYGRPEKFIGLKNYVWVFGNPVFTRALINNGLIIVASLLVQLPLALGVALLVAGRMAGAVWFRDDLLPAVYPRGCRGGPYLALHARRADRDSRHRHELAWA